MDKRLLLEVGCQKYLVPKTHEGTFVQLVGLLEPVKDEGKHFLIDEKPNYKFEFTFINYEAVITGGDEDPKWRTLFEEKKEECQKEHNARWTQYSRADEAEKKLKAAQEVIAASGMKEQKSEEVVF